MTTLLFFASIGLFALVIMLAMVFASHSHCPSCGKVERGKWCKECFPDKEMKEMFGEEP